MRYTDAHGNQLAYTQTGDPDGFPILVQHGMIASIDDGEIFHCLSEPGARVISVARPGYGDSTPVELANIGAWGDLIAGLVTALGLAQLDVFGISSGAPYAYAVAHALPAQVRHVYILSGIPALCDPDVAAAWPYPVSKAATLAEMRALARELFFANLSPAERENPDVRDSLRNDCFGPAQDLRIRGMDWGFDLSALQTRVYMRHSCTDNFAAAERTARLLPNCVFEARENDEHFSQAVLEHFIAQVILPAQ
jgi:pimeloyl-ACP methyl ester carboxylesterase